MNSKIYTDVIEKLNLDPLIDTSNITIGIRDEGIVTLNGSVKSYSEKRAAEEAIKRVKGVRGIANDLQVELIESNKRTDTDIAESVLDSLRWNTLVPENRIKIIVDKGWVTLSGEVDYHYQKTQAELAIQSLIGVRGVTNLIKVSSSQVIPTKVKEQIEKEFHRLATIDAKGVQVEVDYGKVILRGSVSSWIEREEAETAAWSVPGVIDVENKLRVESSNK